MSVTRLRSRRVSRPGSAGIWAGLCLSCCVAYVPLALSEAKSEAAGPTAGTPPALRDGRHDFDFGAGTWHTHVKRVLDAFGSDGAAIELDGTVSTRAVWGGRAWLEEIEADGPRGHWEGLSLFLYDPQSRQWSQTFINSQMATLGSPLLGSFSAGRGELFSQDTFKDRAILVRGLWSGISADTHHYEESYSDDGAKTWKPAFIATKTRIPASAVHPPQQSSSEFDFDIGTWRAHSTRLSKPLSGSTQWTELDGTTVVNKVWGGRANLAEIHMDGGPKGAIDFLALRWYNPTTRQWFMTFGHAADGQLGVPMAGTFKDGRIDFYDAEPFEGRTILVRFSIWPTSPNSAQSEQAFSEDGGRTWEVNYKTTYTRDSKK